MAFENLCFRASSSPEAQAALEKLRAQYGDSPLAESDAIVAIGGDGFMLQTLHDTMKTGLPIYGLNKGTVGFLMNPFEDGDLRDRLARAEITSIRPLEMKAVDAHGKTHKALAINEVSLLRETRQTARLRITIDGKVRMEELHCDGALVATPAGSTAYNLSAHGPILPIDAKLFALTPISAFRPRRWKGALLSHRAEIRFDVLEPGKRPVSAVADHREVRDVVSVEIRENQKFKLRLMFDEGHNLDERVISEQFVH